MQAARSLAYLNSPPVPKPLGKSPRNATRRLTPKVLRMASCSRTLTRVALMHDRCEAALTPSARISRTVLKVPSCVEPPAPKVTEQNSGFKAYNCWRTRRSLSTPWGVLGGKNSTLMGKRVVEVISHLAGTYKKFPVAVAACNRRFKPGCNRQTERGAGRAQALLNQQVQTGIFHDAAFADLARLQLKLRLHQRQQGATAFK